jgi:hypothetical protein
MPDDGRDAHLSLPFLHTLELVGDDQSWIFVCGNIFVYLLLLNVIRLKKADQSKESSDLRVNQCR